jgi:hypothetical protein
VFSKTNLILVHSDPSPRIIRIWCGTGLRKSATFPSQVLWICSALLIFSILEQEHPPLIFSQFLCSSPVWNVTVMVRGRLIS